jgi:hypothetical protein
MVEEILKQCCICKQYENSVTGSWSSTPAENIEPQKISHGYCPPCLDKALKEPAGDLESSL